MTRDQALNIKMKTMYRVKTSSTDTAFIANLHWIGKLLGLHQYALERIAREASYDKPCELCFNGKINALDDDKIYVYLYR